MLSYNVSAVYGVDMPSFNLYRDMQIDKFEKEMSSEK
jgi:hypothetical protein